MRLSLKRAYVGLGLKSVLVSKQDFTKALHSLLPHLEDEKGSKVTKHNITRQSRLVPALIFQVFFFSLVGQFIFFVSRSCCLGVRQGATSGCGRTDTDVGVSCNGDTFQHVPVYKACTTFQFCVKNSV